MEEEKKISREEGLSIIQQMIDTAKQEQKDDGIGWIIWGWLLFLASTFTLCTMQFNWNVNLFFFWNGFGLITALLLVFEACRFFGGRKKTKVKTYTQALFDKLNIGFTISLFLVILSMNIEPMNVHSLKGFALLLGLYGFWILIYGAVLNFRPSIIGAYITWAFAIASLFVHRFELTMLFHALAVLCGYIIPGHIAYKEFNRPHSKSTQAGV